MAAAGHFENMAPDAIDDLVERIHTRKTEIFISLIKSKQLPLRSGIHRFLKEALELGLVIGVCTTANERSAAAVTQGMLSDIDISFVLAGDVVSKKKPDPEIYRMALQRTGLPAEACLVVEDSQNGITAAKGAGLSVLATTNLYTEREDLSRADIIVNCLGDSDGPPVKVLKGGSRLRRSGLVKVSQLVEYFAT